MSHHVLPKFDSAKVKAFLNNAFSAMSSSFRQKYFVGVRTTRASFNKGIFCIGTITYWVGEFSHFYNGVLLYG